MGIKMSSLCHLNNMKDISLANKPFASVLYF
jgi:hypothetical protein